MATGSSWGKVCTSGVHFPSKQQKPRCGTFKDNAWSQGKWQIYSLFSSFLLSAYKSFSPFWLQISCAYYIFFWLMFWGQCCYFHYYWYLIFVFVLQVMVLVYIQEGTNLVISKLSYNLLFLLYYYLWLVSFH